LTGRGRKYSKLGSLAVGIYVSPPGGRGGGGVEFRWSRISHLFFKMLSYISALVYSNLEQKCFYVVF
jgi:hypothetical protein